MLKGIQTENNPLDSIDKSSLGVGMGVAMMMQQAGALVGAPSGLDPSVIQAQIRKAKVGQLKNVRKKSVANIRINKGRRILQAEGRTVTIVNGALYFDYQLVASIPPHFDVRV
uniref:Transposase n=1 Tax=Heterorhabditis bacteriophora TaxID=37862 RepID=A0A1I7XCA1_HETBA